MNEILTTEQQAQPKPETHGRCSVHGYLKDQESDCSTCHGEGMVYIDDDPGMSAHYERCWACGGRGVSPFLDCWLCLEERYEY